MTRLAVSVLVVALLGGAQPDGRSLLTQAQSDLNSGHYASSIKYASAAANAFRTANADSELVRALTTRGLAQMYSGDYGPALATFTEAGDRAQSIHDLEYEIISQNNFGTVCYFTGRYSEALDAYSKAQALVGSAPPAPWLASKRQLTTANTAILFQTLGQYNRALDLYNGILNSPASLPPQEQAQLLANVGVLRRRLGDPQKALLTYRDAQSLYRKTQHRDGEIAVLNNIGILQAMDLHDLPAAIATFTSALDLATKAGDRPLVIHAHLYRGEAHLESGQTQQASADFSAARDQASAVGAEEELWKSEFGLARIARLIGDTARATALLKSAVHRIESLRGELKSSSLRSAFLADKRDVYDLLIEMGGDTESTFAWMEQSRARGLFDQAKAQPPRTLHEAAAALLPGTALLEYWIGSTSGAVIWATVNGTGLRRFPLSERDKTAIAAVPAVVSDSAKVDWESALRPVSAMLLSDIPPLHDQRINRLIVVPDRELASVPFHALPFESGLMVERFALSYLPAAGLMQHAPDKRETRWFWQESLKAFADPAPSGSAKAYMPGIAGLPRLPAARREIGGIASALGGRAELYADSAATKTRLLQTTDAPVLHLATHAFADFDNPELSFVVFAPHSAEQRYDYLFLKEVPAIPLKPVCLVTLSACQTAAGKDIPGEGTQSFARAFMSAGVPSVVTPLWVVRDQATSELMIRFYRNAARGSTLAAALRSAQLDFIRSPSTRHPANWAAFILYGDGDAKLPYIVSGRWLIAGASLALILIVVLRRAARSV